eukprot:365558-Chlamydomonas_euryale.AAC.18
MQTPELDGPQRAIEPRAIRFSLARGGRLFGSEHEASCRSLRKGQLLLFARWPAVALSARREQSQFFKSYTLLSQLRTTKTISALTTRSSGTAHIRGPPSATPPQ